MIKMFETGNVEFYSQEFIQVNGKLCEHLLIKNTTNEIRGFIQFFGERSSHHPTYFKIDDAIFESDNNA